MNGNKQAFIRIGTAIGAFVLIQTPAFAKDDKPFSLSVSAGAEYDSNVTVEQLDVLTSKGDVAAILGASAKYKLSINDKSSLTIGYDFDQSLHKDLTAFDLQTHTLSAGGEFNVGSATLGVDYSFYHILLGGSGFLDMHQINPTISGFITKSIYLRAGYTYLDKSFKLTKNRDAKTSQVAGDGYYFFDNNQGYINLGGRYDNENTVDPTLDYSGFQLSANAQLPVNFLTKNSKLKFGYAYRERNYDSITPSIGARRIENRSSFKIAADVPILAHMSFKPEYRYVDRNSNYAFSNYTENVVTGTLNYRF